MRGSRGRDEQTLSGRPSVSTDVFLLGGTGFVGREFVAAVVRSGVRVRALVRTREGAAQMEQLGAAPVMGDAAVAGGWTGDLDRAAVLVDLVQPPLPRRLGRRAIDAVAAVRLQVTGTVVGALRRLPASRRPLLVSVSGVSDLERDGEGRISHRSAVVRTPAGFARIGVPVRRAIEGAGVEAFFVYLGTVYGPGKAFAARILPDLARGKARIIGRGDNRMALVHVGDAAGAILHLAGKQRATTAGRTWVVADGADTTQRDFLEHAAALMGGPRPRSVPVWLASLIAGKVLADLLSEDSPVDPEALLGTGFRFQYESHQSGLPDTVATLPHGAATPPRVTERVTP
jgi:nucleoside-diphosphate-sugar epimerase